MRKKRKNYTPEEKVQILRRHLVDHVQVSDLCDEYSLQPTVFYRWLKQFFENGAAAFQGHENAEVKKLNKKIGQLEERLTKKHEVLSELMEEHLRVKKNLGES